MEDIFKEIPRENKARLKRAKEPGWVDPMLATLTEERFSKEGWIYEPKYDGERVLTYKNGKNVSLKSRNEKELGGGYPEIVKAMERQEHDFIADGEVVAFADGRTSFEELQKRIGLHDIRATEQGVPVFYYLFDLIFLDGYDLHNLELRYRKALLKKAIKFEDPLRFTPHVEKEGVPFYREMCAKGWEGAIAKDFSSGYVGIRSRSWLKFKCVEDQELVIGGFTDPQGSRIGFGALLVGYYEGAKLRYAGKVGTGYDNETLENLSDELRSLEIKHSPFDEEIDENNVHWVKPKLVAEIGFTEWTKTGKLRHPRFKGLRRDKSAREVVREHK
jgi:bifunctional non-homologous end joining protein LigD